jgi:hypothetical protein
MKKKYLVNAIDISGIDLKVINKIIECEESDTAIEISKIKIEEEFPGKIFKYSCLVLRDIERLQEKELTIREVMKTTYSLDNLKNTIKMYEEMLLKGLDFKTLATLFAPYLMAYDHKLEEFSVSKIFKPELVLGKGQIRILDIGFQYLPKKVRPFGFDIQNYEIWAQRTKHFKDNNFELFIRYQEDKNKSWSFVDFVIEISENIPDVPVRIETIVIQNL